MKESRVLVIQLRQLGDILLTTPCLRAIRSAMPGARITFLSHAMGRLILDDCPCLDEHYWYGDDWGVLRQWSMLRWVRQRRFDLVFDFMGNPRSALITAFSGAPRRYGFASPRRLAYTHTLERPDAREYVVHTKFRLLHAAGIHELPGPMILPWNESHTRPLLSFAAENPPFRDASLRVILSPTHRRPARRWPPAHWAALADWLVRSKDASVVWLWGPGEEDYVRGIRDLCRSSTLMAPRTTFREMAALIGNCDFFVGNSNGPSHVAVAGDVPSLQLHGHTSLMSWCPLTARHRGIQAPGYGVESVPDMAGIAVSAVQDLVEEMSGILKEQAAARRGHGLRLRYTARYDQPHDLH